MGFAGKNGNELDTVLIAALPGLIAVSSFMDALFFVAGTVLVSGAAILAMKSVSQVFRPPERVMAAEYVLSAICFSFALEMCVAAFLRESGAVDIRLPMAVASSSVLLGQIAVFRKKGIEREEK